MGKHLDSPASFWPISLTSCISKLFERTILSHLLFFLESNSILSPHQASFCPGRSTLDQILYLFLSISDGFNKPRPGLGQFFLLLISLELFTLSGILPFSTNSFWLASLLAFRLASLQQFMLTCSSESSTSHSKIPQCKIF